MLNNKDMKKYIWIFIFLLLPSVIFMHEQYHFWPKCADFSNCIAPPVEPYNYVNTEFRYFYAVNIVREIYRDVSINANISEKSPKVIDFHHWSGWANAGIFLGTAFIAYLIGLGVQKIIRRKEL